MEASVKVLACQRTIGFVAILFAKKVRQIQGFERRSPLSYAQVE
jgi:hypothetical protein